MEFISVKIEEQKPLQVRDWTNQQGETKKIKSVELTFSNGIDKVVGEASDDLAEELSAKNLVGAWVSIGGSFTVVKWKTREGAEATSLRYRINKLKVL